NTRSRGFRYSNATGMGTVSTFPFRLGSTTPIVSTARQASGSMRCAFCACTTSMSLPLFQQPELRVQVIDYDRLHPMGGRGRAHVAGDLFAFRPDFVQLAERGAAVQNAFDFPLALLAFLLQLGLALRQLREPFREFVVRREERF